MTSQQTDSEKSGEDHRVQDCGSTLGTTSSSTDANQARTACGDRHTDMPPVMVA